MSASARVTRKRARALEANDGELDSEERPSTVPKIDSGTEEAVPQSSNNVVPPGALKRDEDFWYEDGTVILVARDVEFRVYGAFLAKHSSVFKEMFSQPGHTTRPVSMNGHNEYMCPVVTLTDSPEDLRHVLRACTPHLDDTMYTVKTPSYHTISASIRLGKKYQINQLYQQSLQYLKRHYTSDFYTWLSLENYGPKGWVREQCIGAVNLARFTGELSMLPGAILECSLLKEQIIHGFSREDGSLECLTLADLGLCMKAATDVHAETLAVHLQTLTSSVAPQCKTPSDCRSARWGAMNYFLTQTKKMLSQEYFSDYLIYAKDEEIKVCPACQTMMNDLDYEGRRAVWKRFPELLGIEVPGWETPIGLDDN